MKPFQKCIIVTSADSLFFPFLETMVLSLARFKGILKFSFGVLDQGLTEAEKKSIEQKMDVIWVKPIWHDWVPQALRNKKYIGLQARMELRDYFPGYKFYLWFDADAWAQTPEFYDEFIKGAETCDVSVVNENGYGYHKTFADLKWWYGNLLLCFGFYKTLKLINKDSINIGVTCLKNTSSFWGKWKIFYIENVKKNNKINMDQHAFFGAIHLGRCKTKTLDSKYNWLPHLSKPVWHSMRKQYCKPDKSLEAISVLHLAGPNKQKKYKIKTETNGFITKEIKLNF